MKGPIIAIDAIAYSLEMRQRQAEKYQVKERKGLASVREKASIREHVPDSNDVGLKRAHRVAIELCCLRAAVPTLHSTLANSEIKLLHGHQRTGHQQAEHPFLSPHVPRPSGRKSFLYSATSIRVHEKVRSASIPRTF